MGLLREVKGDSEKEETAEETTVVVGDKKVTIKVKQDESSPAQKRQLLCE